MTNRNLTIFRPAWRVRSRGMTMKRLSLPIDQMRDHYKVVIVGSGYGGAIVAARVARAGQDICVLERGRELHPGEYPKEAPGELPDHGLAGPYQDEGCLPLLGMNARSSLTPGIPAPETDT